MAHCDGEETAETVRCHRSHRIRRVRAVTDRIRKQMRKNLTIGGSWYKLFKSWDTDSSGDISFDELQYVVHKKLGISKLEMSALELKAVWKIIDVNGDNAVTIAEFSAFMRRIDEGNFDKRIEAAVDAMLAQQKHKHISTKLSTISTTQSTTTPSSTPSSPQSGTASSSTWSSGQQGFSLGSVSGARRASTGSSTGSVASWLRSYHTIGGYSSIGKQRTCQMGRPPEENDVMRERIVPQLLEDLASKQRDRQNFHESLCNGGARYPLLAKPRTADRAFEALDGARIKESRRMSEPLPNVELHWSERLASLPTHASLSREHGTMTDLQRKYQLKV
ncbi:hypothetical protein M885DRAFT_528872 [Pelagophyceae sp. CCMP2097]|nr:hypothetical protein M885DRAFT_528872 [Pelagophyceae sp. CCMP2097]